MESKELCREYNDSNKSGVNSSTSENVRQYRDGDLPYVKKVNTEYGRVCDFKAAASTDPKNLATTVLKYLEEGHRIRLAATGTAIRVVVKAILIIQKHKPLGKKISYLPYSEEKEESKGNCTIVYWVLSLEENDDWMAEGSNICNVTEDLKVVDLINNKHLILESIKHYAEKGFVPVSNITIDSGGNTSYVIMVFRRTGK
ncbi:hypothetical protein UT300012_24350 [Paraclostridium bifermentans]